MHAWQKRMGLILLLCVLFAAFFVAAAQAEGAQVTGVVWNERTVDGLYENENGLAYAKVTLLKKNPEGEDFTLASHTTDRSGAYAFAVPESGEYRLRIELPADFYATIPGLDSAALPAQKSKTYTPYFTLEDGQFAEKNIGATKSYAYISMIAFEDSNLNGGRMQSEPLVRNVLAELLYEQDGETYVIASVTSDKTGALNMRNLSAGTYRIRVTLPDNYVIGPMGEKINTFYNCIHADENNIGYSEYFTLEPKSSLGMGVGLVRTGSLTGSLWFDQDFNGLMDAGEPALSDAVVSLHSPSLDLTRTTRPDADGQYAFLGLQPGDYQLGVQLPDGMVFTYPGHSLITEIGAYGETDAHVEIEQTTVLGPIGAMPAASLCLNLYLDTNENGQWDAGEPALPGASATAAQNGKVVATAVSDETGAARFTALRSGSVTLSAVLPEGYIFLPMADSLFDTSSVTASGSTQLTLGGSEEGASVTAAATVPAAIRGMLFEDPFNLGLYQAGFDLLSGFTVEAVDHTGRTVQQARTDNSGAYLLYPVPSGEYTVRFLLNDPYIAAPYAADRDVIGSHILSQTPDYGETELLSLAPGQIVEHIDGGVFRAGVVDGYVLSNTRQDNLRSNDGGLPGISVTLLDENGVPVSDYSYDLTDSQGYYMIKGVLPGTYSLLYEVDDAALFTSPMTDRKEVHSDAFTIGSGSEIHMPALGAVATASMGGFVGQADAPVQAVLRLTAQTYGNVYEALSAEDGTYQLTALRPDTYTLEVSLPDGYVFGQLGSSPIAPTAASSASANLSLRPGEQKQADLRAALPVAFSGAIYYDANRSAAQEENEPGAEGRALTLWLAGREAARLATDENGEFFADHLVPGNYELHLPLEDNELLVGVRGSAQGGEWVLPFSLDEDSMVTLPLLQYASITGQVWSLDGTLNGVEGISVSLLDEKGLVTAVDVTDSQGAYSFSSLLPGEYSLSAVLPSGYLFAREQDARSRSSLIQSLPDGTPQPIPFPVLMGEEKTGVDIGMGAMGSIGDRAWLDENGNGMQDIGEPDMPGIIIELYQHGELIASAVTDLYGRYELTGLYPGEYEMRVTMQDEVKATKRQSEFPLVASILTPEEGTTVSCPVIVPSGSANLHCDLGFQLRKSGVYPSVLKQIPTKNWTPYSER